MSDPVLRCRRLLYAGVTLVALALLTQWFFHAGVLMKVDVPFHLNRIMGIASGLTAGDLPVYVHGFQMQGYGTLDGALYPDLLLYFPAALVACGVPLAAAWDAYWVLAVCLGLLAAWRGYTLLSGRTFLGLLAALLFASCFFLSFCLGMSVGGYPADFFLPYALGALYSVLRRADGARRWPELAFAFFMIAGAHLISTLFCLVLLAFGLCLWRRGLRSPVRRRALLLAAGSAFALLLYRIVPFVYFYRRVDFHIRHSSLVTSLSTLTSDLSGLLGAQLWWGWPLVVLLLAALFSRAFRARRSFLLTAALAAGLTSLIWSGFPWQAIERIPLLGAALVKFQFAMRFLPLGLVPLAYFLSRYLAAAGRAMSSRWARRSLPCRPGARGLSLCLALLAVGYGMWSGARYDFMMAGFRAAWHPVYAPLEVQTLPTFGPDMQPDYLYADVDPAALFASGAVPQPGEVRALSGDIALRSFRKMGTRLLFTYASTAGAEVLVPLFFYPGYEAYVDGTETAVREGAHHVLTLALPPGEHTVFVAYRGPLSFHVSACVSLIVAFLLSREALRLWRRGRSR